MRLSSGYISTTTGSPYKRNIPYPWGRQTIKIKGKPNTMWYVVLLFIGITQPDVLHGWKATTSHCEVRGKAPSVMSYFAFYVLWTDTVQVLLMFCYQCRCNISISFTNSLAWYGFDLKDDCYCSVLVLKGKQTPIKIDTITNLCWWMELFAWPADKVYLTTESQSVPL